MCALIDIKLLCFCDLYCRYVFNKCLCTSLTLILSCKIFGAVNGRNCTAIQGAQIITVPAAEPNRFWIIPLQDAYTNTFATLGSDYNTAAGKYLIVGRSEHLSSHSLTMLYKVWQRSKPI